MFHAQACVRLLTFSGVGHSQAHLRGFFQGAYAHDSNSFKHWAEQLNDDEKNTLGKVLQSA